MKTSEQTNEINTALAKAQVEMANPGFDSQNPHFRNRFASLAAVRNAVIPVLAKHGLSANQELTNVDGGVACVLRLGHSSGQWMEFGPLVMPVAKADAQGVGSSATYGRRYQLMAVCAVVGDDDDDAEAAVGRDGKAPDPRGDGYKDQDMKRAREYATRFRKAIEVGIDDRVLELHDELNADSDFYIAVSTLLSPTERTTIKDAIRRAKHDNGARQ